MSNRLPKQFWRVVIVEGRVSHYEVGSKTYAAEGHARNHVKALANKGVKAEVWTTGVVDWNCVQAVVPDNMDPLF